MSKGQRKRKLTRKYHIAFAISVILIILIVSMSYFTPLSVLFAASNPKSGIYGYSLNAVVKNKTLNIKGLYDPVTIIIDKNGVYHIYAQNQHDLFLAFGFIQAENRLFQLDMVRRASEGNLSPILGPSYENSDIFQLKIGNLLTAERDWNETLSLAKTNQLANQTVMMLEAYSQGVNDYINYAETHNELPFEFVLLHYKPQPWTPVDSFLIQQYMAESLEFGNDQLILSLMYYKMGNLTNSLIPAFSPIPQVYYAGYNNTPNQTIEKEIENIWPINSTIASLAYKLYQEWDPPFLNNHPQGHSNEFVVSGNKTVTGNPILVGGPVLGFSLPFIWFEAQIVAPGINTFGVFLPGSPAPVIGFNQNIAWTLTDVQSISWGTYIFAQTVNKTDYFYNGNWYPIKHYEVNGVTVNWTNWGPIMVRNKNTALVMYWLANNYSDDLGVLYEISTAKNWTQFNNALQNWKAPYQNFAYADKNNIGDISAGIYPIFSSLNSTPYSPDAIMPGNGEEFVSGWIPYQNIPHVYDPPIGFVVSSNQRQVGPSYPYWYGNTMSFSPGTRAWVVYNYLLNHNNISVEDMMELQWNETDLAAAWSMPTIIKALENSTNNYAQTALSYLKNWNYVMSPDSKAATIWFYIYSEIYFNVFYKLFNETGFWPEFNLIKPGPAGGSWPNTFGLASLDEDLIHILMTDNGYPLYNGSVNSLIVNSTIEAMKLLEKWYPNDNYTWGNFYGFYWPSITGTKQLSVGPLSGLGGDYFTLNDQCGGGGGPLPTSPGPGGQSFTFIADLNNISNSYGVYPGGQSENPVSQFYDNYIQVWIKGGYLPLIYIPSPQGFPRNKVLIQINLNP
ncbi:MAG: penicillin acylase family protein [Caldisphaera sp.]